MKIFFLVLFFWSACSPLTPIQNPFISDSSVGHAAAPSPLRILAIDVGQGDATLVTGPTGRTLLIDAGPPGAGLDKVVPLLRSEGIDSLDWILATHYDADHIGGIPEVLDALTAGTVIDRGDFTDKATPAYEDYLDAVPPQREEAIPGMVLDLGHEAEARVVVVNGRYSDGRSIHLNPDEENEASIGLLIRYRDFTYFTAGDLPGGGPPGTMRLKRHWRRLLGSSEPWKEFLLKI